MQLDFAELEREMAQQIESGLRPSLQIAVDFRGERRVNADVVLLEGGLIRGLRRGPQCVELVHQILSAAFST